MSLFAVPLWSHYLEEYIFTGPGSNRYGPSPDQLITITPATVTPVSRSEVKKYLRIEDADTEQDDIIDRLIRAATSYAQGKTGIWFAPTALEYRLMRWAYGYPNAVELPAYPVRSVASVKYIDRDSGTQTVDPSQYQLIQASSNSIVEFVQTFVYPATTIGNYPIRIAFAAGYNDPDGATGDDPALVLPDAAATAIMMMVVNFFENRGDVAANNLKEVMSSADNLLAQLRIYR